MRLKLIFGFIFYSFFAFSQAPCIEWQKCLGGTQIEEGCAIQQANDGGYILGGITLLSNDGDVHGNHGGTDMWIVKLNSFGDTLWTKCLGGTNVDSYGSSIKQTADNGYIVIGYTQSNNGNVSGNHGSYDIWVVKLDENGVIEWQKCLGGTDYEDGANVQQTADGGYILTGSTYSNNGDVSGNHGGSDVWVVKLDDNGAIEWQKCFGGAGDDDGYFIQQIIGGGYIALGLTADFVAGGIPGVHGDTDFWVIRLDSDGDTLWTKCLGGTGLDKSSSIKQTMDGGFILTGYVSSNNGDVSGNHGYEDAWVVKLDENGVIEWQKCLGGTDYEDGANIQQTTDGGYVITGETRSNNGNVSGNHGGFSDVWVVKLDENGAIEWQKCLGGTGSEEGRDIEQTTDGGYILAGYTASINGDVFGNHGGSREAWVVKLNDTPQKYNVTGGSSTFCQDEDSVEIGLNDSETGFIYILFRNGISTGDTLDGTGNALSFGNYAEAGAYTVEGNYPACQCATPMNGNATIIINPPPTAYNVTGDESYCNGEVPSSHVELSGSQSGITYTLYKDGAATGTTINGTGNALDFGTQLFGTYKVFAENNTTHCTDFMNDSAIIAVNPIPIIYNVVGDEQYCDYIIPGNQTGCEVLLDGSSVGATYELLKNGASTGIMLNGTGAALNFGFQLEGSYMVQALNATTGCDTMMNNTIIIEAVSTPLIDLSNDTTVKQGSSIVLNVGLGYDSYQWNTGAVTNSISVSDTGWYKVTVTNYCGTATDSIHVAYTSESIIEDAEIWVPNSFTPNNDNINDEFTIKTSGDISAYNIWIYNKIGQMVYSSTDYNNGWNGNYKNNLCPEGVYIWKIKYTSESNKRSKTRKGSVSLIR